jgi:hypothetical protein
MSRGSQEKHAEVRKELAREPRQFNALGASFFRAAARIGMIVKDMQVIDILDSTGPMTAGQLADLAGLTTGAITWMLNSFAQGLRRDYAAVHASFSSPWSNGQVGDQVDRLKLIKRQLFGHARFDLLRLCVLHTA